MYKQLLSLSVALLSCHAVAENVTNIKAAEVTEPVHVGIFRGFCNKLDLSKLKKPSDFGSVGTSTCEYVTDQTLDPNKPKASVKAWHQAGSLVLVAFQSGGTPVQCTIGDYKTMFVLGGADGLKCTSPEEKGSEEEEAEAPPPAETPPPPPPPAPVVSSVDTPAETPPAPDSPAVDTSAEPQDDAPEGE